MKHYIIIDFLSIMKNVDYYYLNVIYYIRFLLLPKLVDNFFENVFAKKIMNVIMSLLCSAKVKDDKLLYIRGDRYGL